MLVKPLPLVFTYPLKPCWNFCCISVGQMPSGFAPVSIQFLKMYLFFFIFLVCIIKKMRKGCKVLCTIKPSSVGFYWSRVCAHLGLTGPYNFGKVHCLEFSGQSEPAPTNAPVGHSVHRMGCISSCSSWPCVKLRLYHSQPFWAADLWPFLFVECFVLNPDHITLEPSPSNSLVTLLT